MCLSQRKNLQRLTYAQRFLRLVQGRDAIPGHVICRDEMVLGPHIVAQLLKADRITEAIYPECRRPNTSSGLLPKHKEVEGEQLSEMT